MKWLKKLFARRDPDKAAKLVAEGVGRARQGALEAAIACYERALQADPEFALAHLNLGVALQDQFNARSFDSAAARTEALVAIAGAFETALRIDDGLLPAWRSLGHVSRRLGRFGRAQTCFERVLELAPDDFPHRAEAARQLEEVRERAELERLLKTIEEKAAPDVEVAPAEAAILIEKSAPLRADPEAPAALFFALGMLWKKLDAKDAAKEMFEACLAKDPRHVGANRALATFHMQAGDVERALSHSLAAYQRDPANAALVCNVGVCHMSLGHDEEAEEFLKLAQKLDPKDPVVSKAWESFQAQR